MLDYSAEFLREGVDDLESSSHRGSGDLIETQIESSRVSQVKLSQVLLSSALYLSFDQQCGQCDGFLREEEILSGFSKGASVYVITCPLCKERFVPKFTVFSEYKTDYLQGKDGMKVTLLSPITLYKEYINIVE
jgi:hypothetical protein